VYSRNLDYGASLLRHSRHFVLLVLVTAKQSATANIFSRTYKEENNQFKKPTLCKFSSEYCLDRIAISYGLEYSVFEFLQCQRLSFCSKRF